MLANCPTACSRALFSSLYCVVSIMVNDLLLLTLVIVARNTHIIGNDV